jgi:hypothetical protein
MSMDAQVCRRSWIRTERGSPEASSAGHHTRRLKFPIRRYGCPHNAAPREAIRQESDGEGSERSLCPTLSPASFLFFNIDLRSREDWPQWCELRATRHLVSHNWGRINARYMDGGSRAYQNNQQADDRYNPRLPTGFDGTFRSGDQAIDNPIDLDLAYARSALELEWA